MKLIRMSLMARSAALLALLGAPSLSAQDAANGLHIGVDPIRFFSSGSGNGGAAVGNARYMQRFESGFDSLPEDISSHELSLFAPILPLSYDRLRVVTFASYRANWFDTTTPTLVPDDVLHSLQLPVVALYDISDQWMVGGMVMPGVSGDLSSGSDGFSILSALGVGYSHSDSLKFFVGALHSYGFDENRFLPGAGFMWRASAKLSVNVLPPLARVSYDYSEDYKISLFARYDSPTWNVEADAAGPARDINIREIRAGLRLERRLSDQFWAFIAGGVSFGRRLEVETLGSTSLRESDIDPGAFVQGGLNLRF